jgi:hypothetical protein
MYYILPANGCKKERADKGTRTADLTSLRVYFPTI